MTENDKLVAEPAPSLADLAAPEEGVGAWPRGWYRAHIITSYTTGKGKVFETSDVLSKDAASRNLFLCLALDGTAYRPSSSDPKERVPQPGPGGVRNVRVTLNYRPGDLTPQRIAEVREARKQYAEVQGAWPDKDIQAASLSLGRLGQLEKALGLRLPFDGNRFNVSMLVGQRLNVRLTISEDGFNEVAAFAEAGSKI